jgi:hypothetical protein
LEQKVCIFLFEIRKFERPLTDILLQRFKYVSGFVLFALGQKKGKDLSDIQQLLPALTLPKETNSSLINPHPTFTNFLIRVAQHLYGKLFTKEKLTEFKEGFYWISIQDTLQNTKIVES